MENQTFKLKYLANKSFRLNHGFMWVTGAPRGYWWDISSGKWSRYDEIDGDCSSCAPCKTVKAFKRMLRKNPILLDGNPVLVHRKYILDRTRKTQSLDVEAIKCF